MTAASEATAIGIASALSLAISLLVGKSVGGGGMPKHRECRGLAEHGRRHQGHADADQACVCGECKQDQPECHHTLQNSHERDGSRPVACEQELQGNCADRATQLDQCGEGGDLDRGGIQAQRALPSHDTGRKCDGQTATEQ